LEILIALMDDPRALLESWTSPVSGAWAWSTIPARHHGIRRLHEHVRREVRASEPERLIPYGGVHARFTRDPTGDVDRLIDLGIRLLKVHPPHQAFPPMRTPTAHGAREDLPAVRRARPAGDDPHRHVDLSGRPLEVRQPMELDDVAIDFPDLPLLMAHGGRPLYMEEAFFILRRHRKVRLDVSGIPPQAAGVLSPPDGDRGSRAVGTDWPVRA